MEFPGDSNHQTSSELYGKSFVIYDLDPKIYFVLQSC